MMDGKCDLGLQVCLRAKMLSEPLQGNNSYKDGARLKMRLRNHRILMWIAVVEGVNVGIARYGYKWLQHLHIDNAPSWI